MLQALLLGAVSATVAGCGSSSPEFVVHPVVGEPQRKDSAAGEAAPLGGTTLRPPERSIDLADPSAVAIEVCRCRARLAALHVRYGKAHPNVMAAEARIAALEERVDELTGRGQAVEPQRVAGGIEAMLAEVKVELAVLETRYGPKHPRIEVEQAKMDSLESDLLVLSGDADTASAE